MNSKFARAQARVEKLLEQARRGELPMGFEVVAPSPEALEVALNFAFGWILINQEHTLNQGARALASLLRAGAPANIPMLVKLNQLDMILLRDAMDAGADGALLPNIGSADELREIRASSLFPPHGSRGFCGVSRATNYLAALGGAEPQGESYQAFINDHFLLVPIIETMEAVNDIDEILRVPGFEIFHIGSSDLQISLQMQGKGADELHKLEAELSEKIIAAGKIIVGPMNMSMGANGAPTPTSSAERQREHLPYVADTQLLAYACALSLAMRDEKI